jgi:FAD/FMN-containing dehydrogenase
MHHDERRQVVAELREAIGNGAVLTDADAEPFLIDWRKMFGGAATAVVRPGSTGEVAAVVRICAAHGIPIVSQGGNTGISGGSVPVGDQTCVVVSLARLNRIEAVDTEQWTATVQAGVTVQALQDAAAAADRLFAPDWGARGTATVGGAVSTDAGGNNVLRYGNMRDQVLGLEVVLADGQIWDGLRALRKDSSGFDLKHLFIGSEGSLGIVTRAVVKLHPPTPYSASAMVSVAGLEEAIALYAQMRALLPDTITAFELMPELCVAAVCDKLEIAHPMDAPGEFHVLIKLASSVPVEEDLAGALGEVSEQGVILDAVIAGSAAQEERLWTIREELPAATLFPELHSVGLKGDSAVPLDRVADYYRAVETIAAEVVPGSTVYGFGHIGDGNLHMNVLPADVDDVERMRGLKSELLRRVDEATVALGGTLSAEHGVGQDVRSRIRGQKSDVEWALMKRVKNALDPAALMNPGKVLPDG